jgi:hypothetical protein
MFHFVTVRPVVPDAIFNDAIFTLLQGRLADRMGNCRALQSRQQTRNQLRLLRGSRLRASDCHCPMRPPRPSRRHPDPPVRVTSAVAITRPSEVGSVADRTRPRRGRTRLKAPRLSWP